jgi:hypothetical protein
VKIICLYHLRYQNTNGQPSFVSGNHNKNHHMMGHEGAQHCGAGTNYQRTASILRLRISFVLIFKFYFICTAVQNTPMPIVSLYSVSVFLSRSRFIFMRPGSELLFRLLCFYCANVKNVYTMIFASPGKKMRLLEALVSAPAELNG